MSAFAPFTFLHIDDHHMGTPRPYRFRPAVNQRWAAIEGQLSSIDADLPLVGGDQTRDGDTHEYEYQMAREQPPLATDPWLLPGGGLEPGRS